MTCLCCRSFHSPLVGSHYVSASSTCSPAEFGCQEFAHLSALPRNAYRHQWACNNTWAKTLKHKSLNTRHKFDMLLVFLATRRCRLVGLVCPALHISRGLFGSSALPLAAATYPFVARLVRSHSSPWSSLVARADPALD
jgi:hypothetical protein